MSDPKERRCVDCGCLFFSKWTDDPRCSACEYRFGVEAWHDPRQPGELLFQLKRQARQMAMAAYS